MFSHKLLIVAPFCSLPDEPYFNRFLYLAFMLSGQYDITLMVSGFRHFDKVQRIKRSFNEYNINVVYIDEPGYSSNVGLARIYSHAVFCRNFERWMADGFEYDVVYSAFPLIKTNIILSRFKRLYHFKLIIDVQDVWPESISSVLPIFGKLPCNLIPFSSRANRAYAAADTLVAVSRTYLDRALRAAKDGTPCEVVYLGSSFESLSARDRPADRKVFRLVYLGTLSYSYDVKTVIRAVGALENEGTRVELHILGGGPFEDELKIIACGSVFFHGFLGFEEAMEFMQTCDAAVNCISAGASQSVTNKLSDYLAMGIPLLNSQCNPEVLQLLEGVDHENYDSGSIKSFKLAFRRLYARRAQLKRRPNPLFSRVLQYSKIIDLVSNLLRS